MKPMVKLDHGNAAGARPPAYSEATGDYTAFEYAPDSNG